MLNPWLILIHRSAPRGGISKFGCLLNSPIMVPTIKATPLMSPTRLLRWTVSFSIEPGPSSWSGPAAAEPSVPLQPPASPPSPKMPPLRPRPPPLHCPLLKLPVRLPRHWMPSFGDALLFPANTKFVKQIRRKIKKRLKINYNNKSVFT